ncbi:MAG: thiol:disulfide interchange protein DsbA/DsbL [Tepidimonas sp.]|uniref:thiol:disulfide interchange protein DsbA/DsbL n=1 Tax=Tepidimonas sp. TaxID=2002775 RepID=UPI00298ED318|nr:thiol:disulfide interchange protein DsbA/DsbL [Tepidimonas sp.]MCS6810671.1 thiol:disulfide interchange protein DsbA/DsbL [Tepidimonas sp.]MCX7742734.1 thiol:disulfide interchange protein DsbA/DsbL [Tepidimonas sp.]MDW8335489.1 thiol:disulfide interchange protein DsbA/DsbL [Tepidimonas sp.]
MLRRDIHRFGLAGTLLAVWPTLHAQPALREGSDYRRLGKPVPVDTGPGQIEVLEFFSYSCIHCYRFEPLMTAWMRKQPKEIVVRRVPVGFSPAFEPLQRLYYTLEALGRLGDLHDKAFKAVHEERERFNGLEAAAAWAARQGLDRQAFTQTWQSFGISGKVKRAIQLQDAYEVDATPSLGIAGRFLVPGQAERTLVVADALIARVRQA